jgi:DNA repair protein RecO (recombination protein O)
LRMTHSACGFANRQAGKRNVATEKAHGLVIRTTDFSETSRIVTLCTRELGNVRALAKGGRRLRSNFESSLDLLTVCDIVLLRKSSGSLDLLTEARVRERFEPLRHDLSALYGAYYVAEMLGAWSQEDDPHPPLFDAALATLRDLGKPEVLKGPCVAHFELVLLRELGYGPALEACAGCGVGLEGRNLAFTAAGGGVLCPSCQSKHRERRAIADTTWQAMRILAEGSDAWQQVKDSAVRREVRAVLDHYVTYLLGRRPRLLTYLGS